MRIIRFRAWNKKRKEMIEGNVGILEPTSNCSISISSGEGISISPDSPKQYVLMQFTGLKDKNGKEIYEGDILKVKYHYDSYGRNEVDELRNYEVRFEQDRWILDGLAELFSIVKTGEVIGNIYENPDLLK